MPINWDEDVREAPEWNPMDSFPYFHTARMNDLDYPTVLSIVTFLEGIHASAIDAPYRSQDFLLTAKALKHERERRANQAK